MWPAARSRLGYYSAKSIACQQGKRKFFRFFAEREMLYTKTAFSLAGPAPAPPSPRCLRSSTTTTKNWPPARWSPPPCCPSSSCRPSPCWSRRSARPLLRRANKSPSKKSRPADMCGWTGHIQGNLALRVCEAARPSARFSAKFCPQGDTRGKEFLSCAAGRNGFPLERVAFATCSKASPYGFGEAFACFG